MLFSEINQAIFTWVKNAVAGIAGVTVFWEDTSSNPPPRPNGNSVKLSYLTGPTQIGLDEIRPIPGDPVTFKITGARTLIISVNAFGKDSMQILSDLQTSISDPSLMEILSDVNISILRTSPPRDINVASNTRIEARAQMDITMLATEIKVISGLGPIESTELEQDISGLIEIDLYTADDGG